jgi:4-hydroxy-2-oxoheptanedioate aldolase
MGRKIEKADTPKQRCANGNVLLGAWTMIGNALAAEVVSNVGFDWVAFDMQHGCMGQQDVLNMIRAADLSAVPSVVRVPWNDPAIIGQVLDAGALGIIAPMIEGVDDVRTLINACYYPPLGQRSFGPVRVGQRDGMDYGMDANDRVMVLPMIETANALEAVEDIVAMDGVDGVFVGPFDLSIALGLPPGDNDGDAVFDRAIQRVIAACEKSGKFAAVLSNAEVAPLRIRQGFKLLSVSSDFTTLAMASAQCLATVKNTITED